MKYTTAREAIANGRKFYYPGTRCVHGHVAGRYVLNGNCVQCLRTIHKDRVRARPLTKGKRIENLQKQAERNEKTKRRATKRLAPWTAEDLLVVMQDGPDGGYAYTDIEAAKKLGRTAMGVSNARGRFKAGKYSHLFIEEAVLEEEVYA